MIQGVQGIWAEMAADHSDFHTFHSLLYEFLIKRF